MSDDKPARLPEGDVTALSDYFDADGSRQSLAYSGDQVRVLLAAERERCAAIVRNADRYGCACSDRDALADQILDARESRAALVGDAAHG